MHEWKCPLSLHSSSHWIEPVFLTILVVWLHGPNDCFSEQSVYMNHLKVINQPDQYFLKTGAMLDNKRLRCLRNGEMSMGLWELQAWVLSRQSCIQQRCLIQDCLDSTHASNSERPMGIRWSISTGTSLEFFVVNSRLGFWGKFLGRFITDYSLIVYTCPLLWLVTSACKTLMFPVALQNHIVMSIKLMVVPQLMLFESCKVQCFHLTGKVEFWMTLSWFEDFLK